MHIQNHIRFQYRSYLLTRWMLEQGISARSVLLRVKDWQNRLFWLSSPPLPRIRTSVPINGQCEKSSRQDDSLMWFCASNDELTAFTYRVEVLDLRGEMLGGGWAKQELHMCVTRSRDIWNPEGGSQFRFLSSVILMDKGLSCERVMARRFVEDFTWSMKYFGPSSC